jgi:hypothetical protein
MEFWPRFILLRIAAAISAVFAIANTRGDTNMAGARKRPNPRTQETIYRVYRLPEDLRKRVKAKREKHNVNLQAVIVASATESLPKIVATLKTMGLGFDGKKQVARLPMTDSLLGTFKVASKQTGIPASRLLQAALTLTCKESK